MAIEIPVVRYLVPCDELVVEEGRRSCSLRNLIHAIVRRPGEPFPCIRDRMVLYALLTNGRGKHQVTIELAFLDRGTERSLVSLHPREVDFGQDPVAVLGLPVPLKNVAFAQPGQYTFYLVCDGQRIAHQHVEVR